MRLYYAIPGRIVFVDFDTVNRNLPPIRPSCDDLDRVLDETVFRLMHFDLGCALPDGPVLSRPRR